MTHEGKKKRSGIGPADLSFFHERLTSEILQGAGTNTGKQECAFTDIRLTNRATYGYKLENVVFDGTRTVRGPISVTPRARTEAASAAAPENYGLSQNCPNPFNASTVIRVQIPEASEVMLSVYILLGQEVRRLVDEKVEAGWYSALWDGRDSSGRDAASGVYLCRLYAGDFVQIRSMVLLR
ncbi:MAG: FlgD immunoglobulin-like domain containing protein [Candidatus Latescibacterota bacterium]